MTDVKIKRTGRPKLTQYNEHIKELRKLGYGTVRIQTDLRERYGIKVARMTIWKRLHEIDQELLDEGIRIIK